MRTEQIVRLAKTKESWSANHKYNYAPIDYLAEEVFKAGTKRIQFNRFYRNLHKVTDAKTYFAYMFKAFDIYVWSGSLVWGMSQAFPDVSKDTIRDWILENKEEHHIICEKFW